MKSQWTAEFPHHAAIRQRKKGVGKPVSEEHERRGRFKRGQRKESADENKGEGKMIPGQVKPV